MTSTQARTQVNQSNHSVATSSSSTPLGSAISIKRPIDLVGALPDMLRQDLSGHFVVAFGCTETSMFKSTVTSKHPETSEQQRIMLAELEEIATAQWLADSVALALVAYVPDIEKFDEGFLLRAYELLEAPALFDMKPALWIVSDDGAKAFDFHDPNKRLVDVRDESAQIRAALAKRSDDDERKVKNFLTALDSPADNRSQEIADLLRILASRRRTAAKYRREVEDSLCDWLVEPVAETAPGAVDSDLPGASTIAAWLLGLRDRRIREPILKRIQSATAKADPEQSSILLARFEAKLTLLVAVAPQNQSVSATSALALTAWLNSNTPLARAAIEFGQRQDPDNVLLRLVSGAVRSGLPKKAWAEIMGEYSLTELRSG